MWKPSQHLMETIKHYANFPATGVSLRQMVQFGDRPSTGNFPRAWRNHLLVACISDEFQALFSVHRNFSPRNSPSVSRTGFRTWGSCLMASARCLRSKRSRTGMRSPSRYAIFLPPSSRPPTRLEMGMTHTLVAGNHHPIPAIPDARSQSSPVATGPDERQHL